MEKNSKKLEVDKAFNKWAEERNFIWPQGLSSKTINIIVYDMKSFAQYFKDQS